MDYIKLRIEDLRCSLVRSTGWAHLMKTTFFSGMRASKAQGGAKQLKAYLSCSADSMDLLKSFPAVCKMSVRLNTPLPASAACKRLFRQTSLRSEWIHSAEGGHKQGREGRDAVGDLFLFTKSSVLQRCSTRMFLHEKYLCGPLGDIPHSKIPEFCWQE